MLAKKVVYIIPGFKHNPNRKIYKDVGKPFKDKDLDIIFVKIDWKNTTIKDWINQFSIKYYKKNNSKCYLFGFSYGSVISFMLSTKFDVNAQVLCSFSSYFKEDLPEIYKSWKKFIGKRRIEEFSKLEIAKLAPLIKTRTFLSYGYGAREGRFIEKRARETYKKLRCEKYLIKVKDAKHDIGNEEYLKEIKKIIDNL